MYAIEFLPVAGKEIADIARYIGSELGNPKAADKLVVKLLNEAEALTQFPYRCPAYHPIRPLENEYRKLIVDSYLVLYTVNEAEQKVTIARVIYAGRDYKNLL